MKVKVPAKLTSVGEKLTRAAGRAGLKLQKYSPEILMGCGVVAVVGGAIFVARGTIKAQSALADYAENRDAINDCHERGTVDEVKEQVDYHDDKVVHASNVVQTVPYTDQDYQHDKLLNTAHLIRGMVIAYAPGALMLGTGVVCFFAAYRILNARNAAIMAAYTALNTTFEQYRDRVRSAEGEEADLRYLTGADKVEIMETTKEDGSKEKSVKLEGDNIYPSVYARFFDKANAPDEWTPSPEANLMNLRARQNWANDKLRTQGHLFLNEVYDLLGMERSQVGAAVGWILGGPGDDFVDFGLYEVDRPIAPTNRFINGNEASVMLDFNVNGVIMDKI